MSDYTQSTDFSVKDTLPSGDSNKIIRGSDFDAEFSAIQTAVNSKADSSAATLTGASTAEDLTVSGTLDATGTFQINSVSVTSTAAELNILDGVTATTAELNYVDGVTSNIQTQLNTKAPLAGPTFTGTVTIPTADINGGTVDGTDITVGAGKTLDVSAGTLTLANDQISGDAIDGGTIGSVTITSADINGGTIDGTTIGGTTPAAGTFTTFTSTGIDDNATSTAITIDASENVGVGTTSPIDNAGRPTFTVSGGVGGVVELSDDATSKGRVYYDNNVDETILGSFHTGGKVAIYTENTNRLLVDESGNVGIGTTSPTRALTIQRGGDGVETVAMEAMSGFASGNTATTVRLTNSSAIGSQAGAVELVSLRDSSGTGASFVVRGSTASSSVFERMRIDSSGNVGIGTASPCQKLHIQNSGTAYLHFGNDATGDTSSDGADIGYFSGETLLNIRQRENDAIAFAVNSTESMRIDSDGNVGIGTSSPNTKLTVRDGTSVGNNYQLYVYPEEGGLGRNSAIRFASTFSDGWTGSDFAARGSGAISYGGSGGSSDPRDLSMRFYTANAATGSDTPTERARIDSSGNLLVGYTSSNGSYKLQVNSQIYATSSTIATSDARFKENVKPLSDTGDVIDALEPVTFDWVQGTEHSFIESRDVGLIAQDAEVVLKDTEYADSIVAKGEHYGLAYEKFIPLLLKEIQSLRKRVAELEAK